MREATGMAVAGWADDDVAWFSALPDMCCCRLKRSKLKLCSFPWCSVFKAARGNVHAVLGVPNRLTTGLSRLREAHTIT